MTGPASLAEVVRAEATAAIAAYSQLDLLDA